MSIFDGLFTSCPSDIFSNSPTGIDVNPANGLAMVDGIHSVDVMGNPFGMDFTSGSGFPSACGGSGFDSSIHHSGFDSGGFSGGCGGSGFGGSFGGGFGSGGMIDW